MRILQVVLTLVIFTAVMAAVGWVLKQAVPPFIDWAGAQIGIGWVLAILAAVGVAAGAYAYRAEMRARRSDRSF